MSEIAWLWAALSAYAVAMLLALPGVGPSMASPVRNARALAAGALVAALALHTLSLAARWRLLGHGPFTTLHEILSSNLWSLTLVVLLACTVVRELRSALLMVVPVLITLALWLLMADARPRPSAARAPA